MAGRTPPCASSASPPSTQCQPVGLAAQAAGLAPCGGLWQFRSPGAVLDRGAGDAPARRWPARVPGGRDLDTGPGLRRRTPGRGERRDLRPGQFAVHGLFGQPGGDGARHHCRRVFPHGGFLGGSRGPGSFYEARLGDTLRLGGFLVNPEEIETFLLGLPGVAGVQVVAAPLQGDPVCQSRSSWRSRAPQCRKRPCSQPAAGN